MSSDPLLASIESVVEALDKTGIAYAVTGSVASSIHGELVTSYDVDFLVKMGPEQALSLVNHLGPSFYADAEMLREAALSCSMANVFDQRTRYKVDLSIPADKPYYDEVLRRRIYVSHPQEKVSFWVVSPEDIILMKLVWRKDTRSAKQWDNALGVVRIQGMKLDWAYLRSWAQELGVLADLDALAKEGGV